jgi:hypothetical protein
VSSWPSFSWSDLLLLLPTLGTAAGSFAWLLVQTVTRRRTGWITAVALPLVLTGYTFLAAMPETRPSLVLLAATVGIGFLFDQGSSLSPVQGEWQGRRSPWPLLLWGIGTLTSAVAPGMGALGISPAVLESWGKSIGMLGAFSLLGQTLSWVRRLLRARQCTEAPAQPASTSEQPAFLRNLPRLSAIVGGLASLIVIWLALPSVQKTVTSPPPVTRAASGPTLIAFSLDGPNGGLYVARPDGAGSRRVTKESFGCLTWFPDASALFAWDAGRQKMVKVETSGETRPLDLPMFGDVSWAPDGSSFLFEQGSHMAQTVNIVKAAADSLSTQSLTGEGRSSTARWSPDGALIAFQRYAESGPGTRVMIMNPDGSNVKSLADGGAPAWSPDGRSLAMISGAPADAELRIIQRDGKELRTLHRQANLRKVAWSPDGNTLLYAFIGSQPDYIQQFGVVGIDGKGVKLLSKPDERYERPQWSTAGKEILYERTIGRDDFKTELWITDLEEHGRQLSRANDGRVMAAAWSLPLQTTVLAKWTQDSPIPGQPDRLTGLKEPPVKPSPLVEKPPLDPDTSKPTDRKQANDDSAHAWAKVAGEQAFFVFRELKKGPILDELTTVAEKTGRTAMVEELRERKAEVLQNIEQSLSTYADSLRQLAGIDSATVATGFDKYKSFLQERNAEEQLRILAKVREHFAMFANDQLASPDRWRSELAAMGQ